MEITRENTELISRSLLGHGEMLASEIVAAYIELMQTELDAWKFAALDMLDGSAAPHEIADHTGLGLTRCKQISEMFYAATANGWPKRPEHPAGAGEGKAA